MPWLEDSFSETELGSRLFNEMGRKGWRYLGSFYRVAIPSFIKPAHFDCDEENPLDPRIIEVLERQFSEGTFNDAFNLAVARHHIIQSKGKRRYGLVNVVRAKVSRVTLMEWSILDPCIREHTDPEELAKVPDRWVSLGKSLHDTALKTEGSPIWYLYHVDDYYGPQFVWDGIGELPETAEEQIAAGILRVGEPLPNFEEMPEEYMFYLRDHTVATDKDWVRSALDVENFNDFTGILRFYGETNQSPVVPVKLRDTEIVKFFNEEYDCSVQFTNWWDDSYIHLQGYFDDETAFFMLQADQSPYYEYTHGIPTIPLYFGEFETFWSKKNPNWAGWDGNIALFAGTIQPLDEVVEEPEPPEPTQPPEDIDHEYDYLIRLRWEDNTSTDLDLHVLVDGSLDKHVYYRNKHYSDVKGKIWLDYDYVFHGPYGRERQAEVITILGMQGHTINIQVMNYNKGTLTENVELEVYKIDGSLIKKYIIPYPLLSGDKKGVYVCDLVVSEEQCVDKMISMGYP